MCVFACMYIHMCMYCYCTHTYSINLCHLLVKTAKVCQVTCYLHVVCIHHKLEGSALNMGIIEVLMTCQ